MKEILQSTIGRLELGPIKYSENLAFVPLLIDDDQGPEYITLSKALAFGCLTVQELSAAGSVPELTVLNACDKCVLLLDGEELIGAKQNRSVNASILLAPHSETKIPVSCTERGRWSQREDGLKFRQSDNILNLRVRQTKSVHMRMSLSASHSYSSPSTQRAVWDGIEELSEATNSASPTDAMRDVYESQKVRMQTVLADLPVVQRQCGSIFFVGGRVAGCEIVSRSSAYAELHEKLVRSYAVDASRDDLAAKLAPNAAAATAFLTGISNAVATEYKSAGLGTDFRLIETGLIGSALVCDDTVVHLAAFANDQQVRDQQSSGRIRGYRSRRATRES